MADATSSVKVKITSEGADKTSSDLDRVSGSAKKAQNSADKLKSSFSALSAVFGAIVTSAAIGQFIKIADAMSLMNSRLRMTTQSAGEFARQQQALHDIARDTHSDIQDTINLYAKLAPALKDLGKNTTEINNMVSSFTKALQLGGASAEESAAAIKQFGQAMGSGALRGDEFNSIAEASPTLLRYMAEGLNVNVGELRKLGSEGKLTAEALADAFDKMKGKIDEDFANMPLTVGKAFTDLKTEISLFVDEANNASGATSSIAQAVEFLADFIKEHKTGIVEYGEDVFRSFQLMGSGVILLVKSAQDFFTAIPTMMALLIDHLSLYVERKINGMIEFAEKSYNLIAQLWDGETKFGRVNISTNTADGLLEYRKKIAEEVSNIEKTMSGLVKDIASDTTAAAKSFNSISDATKDAATSVDKYGQSISKALDNTKSTKSLTDLKNELKSLNEQMAAYSKPANNADAEKNRLLLLERLEIQQKKITKQIEDFNGKTGKAAKSGISGEAKALSQRQDLYKDYYQKIGNYAELWSIRQTELLAKFKAAGIGGEQAQSMLSAYKDAFFKDAEQKQKGERTKELNEQLKLKDRYYDLQKRAADLSYSEVEKNQKLASIEYERARASYKALLDKKEISKQFYDEAMALEERLFQKQMFDASEWGRVMESGLSGIENAMSSFLDYSSDGFLKFGDLAKSVLGEIYKALVRELIISQMIAAIRRGVSGLFGGVGSAANAGAGAGLAGAIPHAHGGVYAGAGLHAYANSIVSKPTFFAFANGGIPNLGVMGERNGGSPEAIMPLTRTSNGDLGVKAQLANIKIEVINQTKEDAQVTNTQVRQDPEGYVVSLVMSGYAKNKNGIRDMLRK